MDHLRVHIGHAFGLFQLFIQYLNLGLVLGLFFLYLFLQLLLILPLEIKQSPLELHMPPISLNDQLLILALVLVHSVLEHLALPMMVVPESGHLLLMFVRHDLHGSRNMLFSDVLALLVGYHYRLV